MTFFEVKNNPVELRGPIVWPATDFTPMAAPKSDVRIDLSAFLNACLSPDGHQALVSLLLSSDQALATRTSRAFSQIARRLPEEIAVDAATAIAQRASRQLRIHSSTIAENSMVLTQLFDDLKQIRRSSHNQATLNATTIACYSVVIAALKNCSQLEGPLPKQFVEQLRLEKMHPLNNFISWFNNTNLENRQAYYKDIPTRPTNLPQDIVVMAMLEPDARECRGLMQYFYRDLAKEEENVGMLAPALAHIMSNHSKLFSEFAPTAGATGSHTLASMIASDLSPNDPRAAKAIVSMSQALPSRVTPDGFLLLIETVKNQGLKSAERRQALEVIADNFSTFSTDTAERLLPELAYTLQDKDELDIQLKTLAAQLLVKLLKEFPNIRHDLDETLVPAIPDLVDLSYYSEAESRVLPILSNEVFTLLCHKELDLGELALQLRDTLGTDLVKKIVSDQNLRPAEMKKLLADLLLANGIAESLPRMFEKHALDQQAATELQGTEIAPSIVKTEMQLVKLISVMNDAVYRMYIEAVEHLHQKLTVVLNRLREEYAAEFQAGTPLPTFTEALVLNARKRLEPGL